MPFVVDELHDLFAQLDGLPGVIGDAEQDQHVGPAHDAETDLAVAAGHDVDLLQWVVVDLDDIVEEMHCQLDDFLEPLPVHLAVRHQLAQIYGA